MSNVELTIVHVSGLKQGEREIFREFPITIGRAPDSKVRLSANDTRASTRHAEVNFDGKDIFLRDLNSTNGSYLNGKRVSQTKLLNGDIVEFGVNGPKLRFEFLFSLPAAPATNPVKAVPPPLAVQPASANAAKPQFNIEGGGRLQPAVAPPASMVAKSATPPMAIEEREFHYKGWFKYFLFTIGALLLVAAGMLFWWGILIWSIPAGLGGMFFILMGWSCLRINITANNQGLHYQGILRSTMIRWDDIVELKGFRSRTRLLNNLVYVVRGHRGTIVFAAQDYQNGIDLVTLIALRTRHSW
jgi:hypothetical protein